MKQATITIADELKRELEGREFRPFRVTPIEEKDDLGESDVSVNHDKYFADAIYIDSFNEK